MYEDLQSYVECKVECKNNKSTTSYRWLLHDKESLKEQLQWLYETLLEAETNNEKVHIVAHIPANFYGCYKPWTTEYHSIVNRFAHIISGQFNGHTHLDEFSIFYTTDSPSKSLNVAWVGGSGGTTFGLNSNYRIYYVDGESYVRILRLFNVFFLANENCWKTCCRK